MDDIDAGVDSRQAGRALIRDLETVLNSQGLRLNSSKTTILTAEEAVRHFWIQENRYLTIVENTIKHGSNSAASTAAQQQVLRNRFRRFLRQPAVGQWDKVYKRYFKLFGAIKDAYLQKHVPALLVDNPGLRGATLRYFANLGFSKPRLEILEGFLKSGECAGDVSLFEVVDCIIAWVVPFRGPTAGRIADLATSLKPPNQPHSIWSLTAGISLLAKYGTEQQIMALVRDSREVWFRSSWVARQIAAVTPLLSDANREWILARIVTNGLVNALTVMANLARISALPRLDKQLMSYLTHPPSARWPYPLSKVLVARAVLRGDMRRALKTELRDPSPVSWKKENGVTSQLSTNSPRKAKGGLRHGQGYHGRGSGAGVPTGLPA